MRRTSSPTVSSSWKGSGSERFRTSSSLREQLDAPGGQVRILGSRRARADQAANLDDELIAQLAGFLEHLGGIGIENDLQQPFPIAQIDEDDAAVIATPMDPAGNRDFRPGGLLVYLTAVM